jgi:protein SCO1/2
MQRFWYIGIGVVIGLAATLGAGWIFFDQNYTYQGVLIDPPAPAAEFELTDQNGELFTLSKQNDKIVLIFFGYTNCPDVCPVTLSEYKRIKKGLGDQAEDVRFVFITVDPERDNTERLKTYMENFDPSFIGLTGDQESLEVVWEDYGVYQEKREGGSASGYLVDHTARIYTIDKNGNWRLNYPFGMETSKVIDDLNHLLKEE